MRSYDLSPLFRATVGFDRWNDLFDSAFRMDESAVSYPPYNIERVGDDAYRITMAVAGFTEKDLTVTVQEGQLVISGKREEPRDENTTYLYRGIATRAFERKFSLADHVKVVGASLANGVLQVDLVRELPEAMKPRQIEIKTTPPSKTKVIEGKKAA